MSTLLALFQPTGLIDTITSVIGGLLYPLFSIIFVLIAVIQHVFRAFAGIGSMSYDGTPISSGVTGKMEDQGILYYLLHNDLVQNMTWSIALLALMLIVIFTTFAFIKNIYAAKPKNWKEIIGSSIKGLMNFIILPACVLLGVWVGNILLQAINGATSGGGATSMERKLFIASVYNANLYRTGNATGKDVALAVYTQAGLNTAEVADGLTDEQYADLVDKAYAESGINIGKASDVKLGYSLFEINYIVLIAGGCFMLYVLASLAFAMVKRLFYIIILFIISPGVCALYPIDDGAAVKSWTGEVKKQVLSAYGAVAGLNIFFSIVPLIDKISVFDGTGWYGGFGINDIVQIFILVSGLLVVKDIISLISGFAGGDNAYATGSSAMKATTDKVKSKVTSTASRFARAAGAKAAGGSFVGSLFKQGTEELSGLFYDKKKVQESYKDGKEHAFDARKERVKKREQRERDRNARDLLIDKSYEADLAKEKADVVARGGKSDDVKDTKLSRGFNRLVKRSGFEGYGEDAYKAAMAKAKTKEDKEAITAEYVKLKNSSSSGYLGAVSRFADAILGEGSMKEVLRSQKVADPEKIMKDYEENREKDKTRSRYETSLESQETGLGKLITARTDAISARDSYFEKNKSDIEDGQLILKTASIEQLKADTTKVGISETEREANQVYYEKALAAQHYDELEEAASVFSERVTEAAKAYSETAKQLAELEKGEIKSAYSEVAETLKNALSAGKSDEDLLNVMKELKTAMLNLKNPSATGKSLETLLSDLKTLLEKIK